MSNNRIIFLSILFLISAPLGAMDNNKNFYNDLKFLIDDNTITLCFGLPPAYIAESEKLFTKFFEKNEKIEKYVNSLKPYLIILNNKTYKTKIPIEWLKPFNWYSEKVTSFKVEAIKKVFKS